MKDWLSNFWWFVCKWRPVRIKWNSPRLLWRMAMRQQKIRQAMLDSLIQAEELEEAGK